MIDIIKASLWEQLENQITVAQEDFEELKSHSLVALPGFILSSLKMQDELRNKWNEAILKQMAFFINYQYLQNHIPITVPYVILKGTSAAQYYPHPELRAMGDIDVMTKREDFKIACDMLCANGYREVTNKDDVERTRQRVFLKNNVVIEMHSFFASFNDPVKVKLFDDLIIDNIQSSHVLPDLINGLVLIEHINQHMENGLGLRQIIDWMMFVDKCLPDDKWPEFQKNVDDIGLETLALVATRMCEIYLGLSLHQWCKDVDQGLCEDLMEYILACGNFGYKLDNTEKVAVGRIVRLKHPIKTIRELQQMGIKNWSHANNPILKPFAWIWQGIQSAKDTPDIINTYNEGKRLDVMFDSLGVKRAHRGLVYFENGDYIKK